jgi:hypothetical protein
MHTNQICLAFVLALCAYGVLSEKVATAETAKQASGTVLRQRARVISEKISAACVEVSSQLAVDSTTFAFYAGPNKTAVIMYAYPPERDVWIEEPHRMWSSAEVGKVAQHVVQRLEDDLRYTVDYLQNESDEPADTPMVYQTSTQNGTNVAYLSSFRVSWKA